MKEIRAIALDVDGVLTDGGVWWGPNGEEWKRFSFADIMGVSNARKAGLILTLISGEDSPLVDRFAAKFEITDITKGCEIKRQPCVRLPTGSSFLSRRFALWATTLTILPRRKSQAYRLRQQMLIQPFWPPPHLSQRIMAAMALFAN